MKDLDGRVAVVTGGANGIGLGLATRFLEEGMKVVIADINLEDLEIAEKKLRPLGEVLAVQTDVAQEESIKNLAAAAVHRFGAVHVLCNNAGVGGTQRFDTVGQATWDWVLGVNLWGVIHGCRIFLPILAAQDEAYIINTASMAGYTTGPYQATYKVAKAGVVALSESLANEFEVEYPHVGMAVLAPAYTATAIRNDERNAPAGHIPRSIADPDLNDRRNEVYTALESEGISPAAVAGMVVQAMAEGKTHIFPHPEWFELWQKRVDKVREQIQ